MNREHQLSFCRKCSKQSFSLKNGIVCSLTDLPATFLDSCSDYEQDKEATAKEANRQEQRKSLATSEETMGLNRIGIKSGVTAGLILIFAGLLWFLIGVFALDRLFLYPFVLIVLGIIAMVRGSKNSGNSKARKKAVRDTLDSDELDEL